ncbi:MAG: DUF1573 domain-containing protein [Bergeyella sp.]|nr:DUF1573 domain-containing protein [Bergeyella sp.]
MKKILFGLFLAGGSMVYVSAQKISFENPTIDYGTVKQGSNGSREFIVKNIGNKPLIISSVKPSCGCTTPSWSKEPILPGKTGKIEVKYDTSTPSPFQKLIEVYSNDPENGRAVVYIKGVVTAK